VARSDPTPSYQELYYTQILDHYTFPTNDVPNTYQERYLISYDYWGGVGYPIFFYAGNEGDIFMFWNNTGFMFTLAQEFGALVIFAEHRYYGLSLPFGDKSFDLPNLRFLTSEQAMADYANLIFNLKQSISGALDSKVIVFGGSYGGMLASWIRMRYPNIFHGALAASAPILQFQGQMKNGEQFSVIVTRDYALSGPSCPAGIKLGYNQIILEAARGAAGLKVLTEKFMLCSPLKENEVEGLIAFLNSGYQYMAMTDYPSPSDFLQPLPAWPVDVACQYFIPMPDDLLTAMRLSIGVYYNSTGDQSCFDIHESSSPSLGDEAWEYQACTEMVMPVETNGIDDMFLPEPWNYDRYKVYCQETFNVTPQPGWTWISFWGREISTASNIIFSNGRLDPWMPGGVLFNASSSLPAILIDHSAHHLDLRAPDPADPQSVTDARNFERQTIAGWLNQ